MDAAETYSGDPSEIDPNEWTVARHLQGKPAEIVALYRQFIALVEECGPFHYSVSKSAITLKGERRGFAGAALTATQLRVYLDLQRTLPDDPRVMRSDPYGRRLFVHHLRISGADELDETFQGWLSEAYDVGQGAHLGGKPLR